MQICVCADYPILLTRIYNACLTWVCDYIALDHLCLTTVKNEYAL